MDQLRLQQDSSINFDFELLKEKLNNFKSYDTFKKYVYKKQTSKLYYNTFRYNQCYILNEFIKLLYNNFGDRLLINTRYNNKTLIHHYDEKLKPFLFFNDSFCYCNFIIDNYHYHIQFDENPFFDSSYITTNSIYLLNSPYYYHFKNRFYILPCYAGRKENNINIMFDIYDVKLKRKKAANKLYKYFIENCYKKPSKLIEAINDRRYKRGFSIRFIDADIEYLSISKNNNFGGF